MKSSIITSQLGRFTVYLLVMGFPFLANAQKAPLDISSLSPLSKYITPQQLNKIINNVRAPMDGEKIIIKGRLIRNRLVLSPSSLSEYADYTNKLKSKSNAADYDTTEQIAEFTKAGLSIFFSTEVVEGNTDSKEVLANRKDDPTVLNPQQNVRAYSVGSQKDSLATFYYDHSRVDNISHDYISQSGTELVTTFFYQKTVTKGTSQEDLTDPSGPYSFSANVVGLVLRLSVDKISQLTEDGLKDNGGELMGSKALGQTLVFILDPFDPMNKALTHKIQNSRWNTTFSSASLTLVRKETGSLHYYASDTNDWLYNDTTLGIEMIVRFAP